MKKLSEIIKTDCYIDCGTNEKLREVYPLIDMEESYTQKTFGIGKSETLIRVQFFIGIKRTSLSGNNTNPIHHISQIDLNA